MNTWESFDVEEKKYTTLNNERRSRLFIFVNNKLCEWVPAGLRINVPEILRYPFDMKAISESHDL